jgi:hypothetical protein
VYHLGDKIAFTPILEIKKDTGKVQELKKLEEDP